MMNGASDARPSAIRIQASGLSAPCRRMVISPAITSPMTSVMSRKPIRSNFPPDLPGSRSIPKRIRKKQTVTTIAGSISTTVIDVLSTMAPLVRAPMITASSSAPTRIPAARRVSRF